MCGILGTSNSSISLEKMELALNEIIKRGPDNQAIIYNKFTCFGHTRLAIVDLDQRSNQPFIYEHQNRKIIITFNGEIYNYLSIKDDLVKKGYRFETCSDTEVVCAAYCEYGLKCFDLFEGMWAVAINEGCVLVLSRDRVGKKPLYYCHVENEPIFFGSSLKSVSILSGNNKLSVDGIELYFALGFIPKHYSIFENIFKIEPGYIHQFEINDQFCKLIKIEKSIFKPENSTQKLSVKNVIHTSVEKRLLSDVPVTTLMSGGIDSTIITTILNKINPNVDSYFVDFNDKKLSEKKWANYLTLRNNIKLNTIILDSNNLKIAFKDYYSVYDEPFADYSGIPSTAIFKEVSKKYKVVLTGDGGDELFYGYPHYYKKFYLYYAFNFLKLFKNSTIIPSSIRRVVGGSKKEFESNYLKNHALLTPFATSVIDTNFNECVEKSKSFIRGIITYDRDFYNLPEKYLVKVDRASMFSGVEVRSPFMDENLARKIQKTATIFLFTPFSSKLFLKIVFFKLFGLKYLTAKKKGFTPPIEELRVANFKEEDFLELKIYLKTNCINVYTLVEKLDYSKLEKDKILFDRFFFFNEWKKSQKNT